MTFEIFIFLYFVVITKAGKRKCHLNYLYPDSMMINNFTML